MTPFKCAYWVDNEDKAMILLTMREDSHLSNRELLDEGIAEYRLNSLRFNWAIDKEDYCTDDGETAEGQIKIGEWHK